MLPDWLWPLGVTILVLLLGQALLQRFGTHGAGACAGSGQPQTVADADIDVSQEDNGQQQLAQAPSQCSIREVSKDDDAETAEAPKAPEAYSARPAPAKLRFRLVRAPELPALPPNASADVWEVCSTEDANALLGGCPAASTLCCSFTVPYADGMNAQRAEIDELAAAQLAGLEFATVDMRAFPEAAAWAMVETPLVRLMEPDGTFVADFKPAEVKQGFLRKKVLSIAANSGREAESKLQQLALRYPGGLSNTFVDVPISNSTTQKMQQNGVDVLLRLGGTVAQKDGFGALCQASELQRIARVSDVAGLARILYTFPVSDLLPFLDVARRLPGQKLLGGSNPGATEALERLLDAVLRCGFNDNCSVPAHPMLALHFVVNCFVYEDLREELLPVVGQLVRSKIWASTWGPAGSAKTREAAVALLLNASIVLRSACCRVQYPGILKAAIDSLGCLPDNVRLNLAVGNLLAVGGQPDDAKRVLQAQPLPSLRPLAAALLRDELDGQPEGRAFPGAWVDGSSDGRLRPAAQDSGDDNAARLQRPPRAAVPARHRGRRGGG